MQGGASCGRHLGAGGLPRPQRNFPCREHQFSRDAFVGNRPKKSQSPSGLAQEIGSEWVTFFELALLIPVRC